MKIFINTENIHKDRVRLEYYTVVLKTTRVILKTTRVVLYTLPSSSVSSSVG